MRVVLDTNVLVSALLTPFGPSAKVLDVVLAGETVLLYDDRIMTEYEQVLSRKKFNFNKHFVHEVLDYLLASGERVNAGAFNGKIIDVFDLPFIEVARSAKADAVVTGNKKHFSQKDCGCLVLSPAQFINQ